MKCTKVLHRCTLCFLLVFQISDVIWTFRVKYGCVFCNYFVFTLINFYWWYTFVHLLTEIPFKVDRLSGEITLSDKLDYEKSPQHRFTVRVVVISLSGLS